MARYLVIEFDNDRAADKMRSMVEAQTRANKAFRVVGMFARPTKWCTCPTPEGYIKDEVAQGARFGWWVHRICRRARRGTHQCTNLIAPKEVLGLDPDGWTYLVNLHIAEIPVKNIHA